jgi:hypothetical protein
MYSVGGVRITPCFSGFVRKYMYLNENHEIIDYQNAKYFE